MPLTRGTKIGHYEIAAQIGEGGMGEVYRAHDTKLKRDVALKLLPEGFARDPNRLARFQREAQVLASLNHPNIAHIYGVEERALIMELVGGEAPKGPLPFDEAWKIALQIADALEYAHDNGIVHRDLKPANVKVNPEGVVKLLDFGLAKAWRESGSSRPDTILETLTIGETEAGVILGTAAYMAPEQAAGKPVDKRADIWSWGVVLYELLTGKRLFKGEDTADTLRLILTADPDLDQAPERVRRLLKRCLEKQTKHRLRDIGDARFLLEDPASLSSGAAGSTRRWWPLVAAGAAALLATVGFWRLASEPEGPEMGQYRIRPFAIEDYAERNPVWSPDGKSIAYAANQPSGSELRVKSLDGSPPITLASVATRQGSLGINQPSWTPDGGTIYYINSIGINYGPVFSVSRAGGEPVRVIDEPVFAAAISPDGKILATLNRDNETNKRVLSLSSPPGVKSRQLAVLPESNVQHRIAWSPDQSKILVWLQSPDVTPTSSIWLVNVNTGVAKRVATPSDTIWLNFSWLPDNRRVAIAWPRTDHVEDHTDLSIFDTETGRRTLLMPSAEDMADPSVSPDGKSIAFQAGRIDFDIMEFPLDGSPPRPLLASKQWEDGADWSPVAREYVYVSGESIWLRRNSGAGREMESRPIVSISAFQGLRYQFSSPSFSPDGTKIAYIANLSHATNIWISSVSGGAPAPVGDFEGAVTGLTWSPDGRWIAVNWTPTQSSSTRLVKIRVGSEQPVTLANESCASAPVWSPDSSRILCSKGDVLYTIPADGGQPESLGKEYEPLAAWSRDIRYLYTIRNKEGKRELGKLDWKSGAFQPITALPLGWTINSDALGSARMSPAPDNKSLATTIVRNTGDIWILEGFQQPPSLWQRLIRHSFR